MSDVAVRDEMAQGLLARTRAILDEGDLDRARLKRIEALLAELSARAELWGEAAFAEPSTEEKQNRFQIARDPETGLTLYLNVMRPGKKIPPHNHTTWACVSAVVGSEINTIFKRLDDGSVEGRAQLEVADVIDLCPGTTISLLPDDIHSVEIRGDQVIRHLHFYGRPLETLSNRLTFDLAAGTCKVMDIGVKTKT